LSTVTKIIFSILDLSPCAFLCTSLLTLSTHVREGYSSCSICWLVCLFLCWSVNSGSRRSRHCNSWKGTNLKKMIL